ncbi:ABC transporter C family member 3-like [Silene latifolia]|uniref:ABC transporter C family member 3-like n=1 Tax=Silene latifolia TaxID=37657 RepID=UPI003D7846D1
MLELELVNQNHSTIKTKTTKRSDTVTPYANANIFSVLSFSWINSLLATGYRKTLDLEDVPQINSVNTVSVSLPILQTKLDLRRPEGEIKVTESTLAIALFLSSWKEIAWTFILAVISTVAQFVGPYLIDYFVQSLNHADFFRSPRGYILALAFCASSFLQGILRQTWFFKLKQVGLRMRSALSMMIYDKVMKLKQGEKGIGDFINLVAVDVRSINSFMVRIHDYWLIFLQTGLGLGLLYMNLGIASFVALAVLVCIMLSNVVFMAWLTRIQQNLRETRGERMNVTTETLKNMRILKLQGWEMRFLSRIFDLRKTETSWLKKNLFGKAIMASVFMVAPTLVALATFGCCILLRVPLDVGKILTALATFRVLQEPIYLLPDALTSLVQMKVSLGKFASFLSLDEINPSLVQEIPSSSSGDGDGDGDAIEISDGNFTWDPTCSSDTNVAIVDTVGSGKLDLPEPTPTLQNINLRVPQGTNVAIVGTVGSGKLDLPEPTPTLQNINLRVPQGTNVAIVGTVGSGKSSLLSSILGEMGKISGQVSLCGTKAYVPQTPWIQSGTIQDNILFGKDMDRDIYDKVIKACCLTEDLKIMSFGDQTVIGERGINLSGGQKQRIQIARAVYHGADIYLFDDPFSALDAHTSSHLYKEVLLGLLKEKTVVYVTHQVEFLSEADLIVFMKDGMIEQTGTYNELEQLIGSQCKAPIGDDSNKAEVSTDVISKQVIEEADKESDSSPSAAQVVKEEEREKGSVGFKVYWKYSTVAYRGALVVLVLLCRIISVTLGVVSYYWLAFAAPSSKAGAKPSVTRSRFITVYAALAIAISISTVVVDMLVATAAYATATILFRKMLESIFRAPMSFFDATPSGRFLSRCSTDQSAVETEVPYSIEDVYSSVLELVGIVVVMAMVAWPVLMIFIPVAFVSILYQRYYMPSARELSRLSGICEAPITQHFVETIGGSTTIRSFNKQESFRVRYMKILDTYSRLDFHNDAALKWLLFRQDALASTTFAFLLIFLVSFGQKINPAIAGLAVSYGLTLSNSLIALIWNLCACGTKMISVERILQYTSIPSEAPLVIPANRPDSSWPSDGEIRIIDLKIRYAPHLPIVLHGLTCTFPARKSIGIVGRTGSGKSTLVQALLRIVEPTSGQIMIDGVDISTIGLHDLRSKVGIIPQEPVMFQGTIRTNLDPLQQYRDDQLWEALDKCQLGDEIRKKEKKLESNVTENGENWSMGQKQLICLGRVLLKKCRVLLLDEATASVDGATDNLIQQRLQENFSDCTIITIAHRMTSVLDGDLVLLLNNGEIEEFDDPNELLENKSSSFAKLVAAWSNLGNQ